MVAIISPVSWNEQLRFKVNELAWDSPAGMSSLEAGPFPLRLPFNPASPQKSLRSFMRVRWRMPLPSQCKRGWHGSGLGVPAPEVTHRLPASSRCQGSAEGLASPSSCLVPVLLATYPSSSSFPGCGVEGHAHGVAAASGLKHQRARGDRSARRGASSGSQYSCPCPASGAEDRVTRHIGVPSGVCLPCAPFLLAPDADVT